MKSYLGMLQTYHNYLGNPESRNFTLSVLKRQLPSLQGNRFCNLSLTALPVDYKPLGGKKKKKQNTPSSVPSEHFSLASLLPVLRQRHLMKHLYLKSRRNVSSPLHPGKQQQQALVSVCSPATLRNVWSQGTSSAEPFQTPCGFIYMYFHISFLYVTAASVWQQVTTCYRFHYGRQARRHHAEQSQFRKLPTICIAEVTFYPGCAIAVI